MTIDLWIIIVLVISFLCNLFLLWFLVLQSRKMLYISENIGDLLQIINSYKDHLGDIYKMEMFYGDETLEFLLDHTKSLITILEEEYGDIVSITNPLEIEINEEEGFEEEKQNSQEQDVLYAGTRKRDS